MSVNTPLEEKKIKAKKLMYEKIIGAFRILTHSRVLTDKQRGEISAKIQNKYKIFKPIN